MSAVPRILLLSGTSLVGQNVLACLAGCRPRLTIAATTSAPDEPIAFAFDEVYLTPEVRRQPEAFATRFDEILSLFAPDLVIPCRDDDVSFVATERTRRPALSRRFLCGAEAVAEAMLDKLESARFSARHDLPFAPTLLLDGDLDSARGFAAACGYPLITKPRRGFASRGVRLILDDAQLARACAEQDLVVQKFFGDVGAVHGLAAEIAERGIPLFFTLEDTKLSIQASIAPDGKVTRTFASGNDMRLGRSESVRRVDDPAVRAAAERWAGVFAEAGWRGPLNIQCRHGNDGTLTIHEYNGRFTGATAARQLLGFDEVGVALHDWLGIDFAAPVLQPAAAVVRYPCSWALAPEKSELLRRNGCWRALGSG